jgi:membrane protease YdiL (CAAX protease family)
MNVAIPVSTVRDTTTTWQRGLARVALSALFLICGFAVFSLGVDYHTRFWTNTSGAYKVGVSVVFALAALVLRRSARGRAYWPIALAFCAASLTNVATWYLAAPLQRWLLRLGGVSGSAPEGLVVQKAVDALLRLTPIVALVWLSGEGLGSLLVGRGNWRWSLGIGALALANLLATAIAVAASGSGNLDSVLTNLPWWLAFSLINAVMEEIWYRSLFLRLLTPLIGAGGALWVTSLSFGISHTFAAYIDPASALVFGVIVLTLGLAWALLMQKTTTIWGSVLYHAAADTFWAVVAGF